jgi:membrane protease YdiL (CAAX protease family)
MLDPTWALTRPILWLALAGMLAVLIVRAIRKDRREYARFKRYRTTAKRQAMLRRWLLDSALWLGGLAIATLVLAGAYIAPLLGELTTWPVVRDIRGVLIHDPGLVIGVGVALLAGFTVLTVVGLRAARREKDLPTIGDIAAMLPRNRQELRIGAVMSVNAGVVEELLFRLGMPALIFGATGSAVAAIVASLLLFGALHAYQGIWGVVGTMVVGGLFLLAYVVTGTILWPIVLHALFDLRSLVLIPMVVYGVHRVDGVATPVVRA